MRVLSRRASPVFFRSYVPYSTSSDDPSQWVSSDLYHRNSTRFHISNRDALSRMDPIPNPRYPARSFSDYVAYSAVRALRVLSDVYFKTDYVRRAVMLETVAAVPGMVASVMHHLQSLRKAQESHWIKPLMDEAENERMHLMSMVEIWKPSLSQRATIFVTQMAMVSMFTSFYIVAPKTAHRFVGYLEEEAVVTYTHFLEAIDAGHIKNVPAPQVAIEYWSLPKDATLRDVVLVIRADECDHRDVNHFIAKKSSHSVDILSVPFVTPVYNTPNNIPAPPSIPK